MQAKLASTVKKHIKIHQAIAEQGKLYALEGNHDLACRYYKHAMQMAVQSEENHSFLKHYLECLLESLELTANYGSVTSYCDQMIGHYLNHTADPEISRSAALLFQRKGVILLKMKQTDEAVKCLQRSQQIMEEEGKNMPLAQNLLFMVASGLQLDNQRILAEQHRNGYFIVSKELVQADIAIKLPEGSLVK